MRVHEEMNGFSIHVQSKSIINELICRGERQSFITRTTATLFLWRGEQTSGDGWLAASSEAPAAWTACVALQEAHWHQDCELGAVINCLLLSSHRLKQRFYSHFIFLTSPGSRSVCHKKPIVPIISSEYSSKLSTNVKMLWIKTKVKDYF